MLYRGIDYENLKEGELIQFFGVHVVRWQDITHADPTMAFVEDEEATKELERLQDCANELACYEYAGVDNWEGQEQVFEIMKENFPETYTRKFGE